MSDAELLLTVESRKKSGWLAAFMNLVLPGAGYAYCARWVLGIVVFAFVVAVFVILGPLGYAPFVAILFIDGFLCAGRYNKNLITQILKERAAVAK